VAYEELLATASPELDAVPATHDTVVTILYTSGTTGHPKGAMITQGMLVWHAVNVVEYLRIGPDTVGLVVSPLFHTGGLNCFANPTLHFGGTSLVMRTFDAAEALRLASDPTVGITLLSGVPTVWLAMSQVPAFNDATFPALVAAGIGGAPAPVPLLETWLAKGVVLQQVYGMTETCPSTTIATREAAPTKLGSAGTPALHTEVRIVDDAGCDCPVGTTGELWVRGPSVTPGYWNRPEATAASFVDGFLRTGDAAYRDTDGHVYVVDRWKDMYISGGENVYPSEVESVLYQLPEIAEVAVFGVADERWGEVGRAAVVLRPGATLEPTAITRHCLERLAKYKVPRSYEFVEAIPHNAAGKVLKRELRERFGT
jgi:fatty-acyl-CoA synthase